MFPGLKEKEIERHHSAVKVRRALRATGFSLSVEQYLWETRLIHRNLKDMEQDILRRRGRSILHELNDEELHRLTRHISYRLTTAGVTGPGSLDPVVGCNKDNKDM